MFTDRDLFTHNDTLYSQLEITREFNLILKCVRLFEKCIDYKIIWKPISLPHNFWMVRKSENPIDFSKRICLILGAPSGACKYRFSACQLLEILTFTRSEAANRKETTTTTKVLPKADGFSCWIAHVVFI